MQHKSISIICACFNAAKTIEGTILSVIKGEFPEVEFIIIDGGSTDGTIDIIRKYQDKVDCFLTEPDNGIYDAWNKGVIRARGRYIAFIGADDVFADNAITGYLSFIESNPDIELVSSKAEWIDGPQVVFGRPWTWSEFKRHMCITHVGAIHHKGLFERNGLFDPSYSIAGDYEFLLRPGPYLKAGFVDEVFVRMGRNGVSNTRILKVLLETRRAKITSHASSALRSNFDFLWAYIKFSIKKYILNRL